MRFACLAVLCAACEGQLSLPPPAATDPDQTQMQVATGSSGDSEKMTMVDGPSGPSSVTGTVMPTGPSGASGVSGASNGTGMMTGPCPAPAPSGNEYVVYGEAVATNWTSGAWNAITFAETTATVCSGSKALTYSPGQYDGAQFYNSASQYDFDAGLLRYRIYVDRVVTISAAAAPNNSQDIHAYFLQPSSQWVLQPGWNEMEFVIPTVLPPVPPSSPWTWTAGSSWGTTGHILFERQSCNGAPGACAVVNVIIDDVRLIAR